MRNPLFLLALLVSFTASAQNDTILEKYLANHRAIINIRPDSTYLLSPEASTMIRSCMKGKSLFALAENTSHDLDVYKRLRPALIQQFIPMNLKYVFIEWGRSVAYCLNAYLDDEYKMPDQYIYSLVERKRVKNVIGNKRTFSYVGIDFERGIEFNDAVNNLLRDVDTNSLHESRAFVVKIKDISSAQVPPDSNGKRYYKHFHNFYKKTQEEFYRDSLIFKKELGEKYYQLAYLLSNPNTQLPPPWTKPGIANHNRNPELAENLLNEMTPLDTSSVYFLSIGLEHAQLKSGMMIPMVSRNELLKNRIVKMNEYCEHCMLKGTEAWNLEIGFMNGAVLKAFSNSANSDLVIFDLSQLPDKYAFIKEHGDLLLFAKNQH